MATYRAKSQGGNQVTFYEQDLQTEVEQRLWLEHDLLQALPLYVFIGLLLQRLPLADALYASIARLLRGSPAGSSIAGLAVGALVAPMNGSVASSAALLSRLVAPRLRHMQPSGAIALVSAAATIGVVVPPSLVLILLGDAMLRAHTEASLLPGYTLGSQRIVNTQDVLHAALLPALAVLALWGVVAWWSSRSSAPNSSGGGSGWGHAHAEDAASLTLPQRRKENLIAGGTALAILALLGSVFMGWLFAVEAAATGGCLLALVALVRRSLSMAAWRDLLAETLELSGALFALLVGATTFSLVFRLFGTDRWLAELVLRSPLPPLGTSLVVLAGVALCALVLDAFEMIFVFVPIVGPLLVVRMGDAQQVSVLLLLALQASFLLPPLGYAVIMARSRSGLPPVATQSVVRALLPFLAAQLVVAGVVFARPGVVHLLDAPAAASAPSMDDKEIEEQMREMSTEPEK
jgi:TRAP-type mannitol/chloroaromatic compound transport system permease large subunit